MNLLPVIARELRAQARQPFTHLLRVLGVVALLAGGFLWPGERGLSPRDGIELFAQLHRTLFLAIWVLVPLGAADCLSRERREGTLPLLLLTPLRPAEIVVAKGLAHGLRALTLLVAVAPVLTIPFLLGGLGWAEVTLSGVIHVTSAGWALAVALLASAVHTHGVRAQATAVLLATVALLAYIAVNGWFTAMMLGFPQQVIGSGLWLVSGGFFAGGGSFFPALKGREVLAIAGMLLASAAVLWMGALICAVMFIGRVGHELPPWAARAERYLCRPVLGVALLRGWLRRTLERNPIGWLERRRWQGRLLAWAWIAVLASIYSYVVTESFSVRQMPGLQRVLGWLLVMSMVASAAGSFRRERETGALELLLVCPLSAGQIVGGRLRGLWGQFLPAFGLWVGVWLYWLAFVIPMSPLSIDAAVLRIFCLSCEFLLVPVIGLYFSLRCRSFLVAFVWTVAMGIVLPGALPMLAWTVLPLQDMPALASVAWTLSPLGQALVAGWAGVNLVRRLQRREFALERATG